jgi:phosphate transport system substrate-binding protein
MRAGMASAAAAEAAAAARLSPRRFVGTFAGGTPPGRIIGLERLEWKGPLRPHAIILAACLALPGAASPRDQVRVVGSSTTFPYTQAVAEEFSSETRFPSPVVEATGTGGGMQLFCAGVGPRTPDLIAASRRILPSEVALCRRNGIVDITEARFGEDAVVLAQSRRAPPVAFSRTQLFQALAASVEIDGQLVPNPYRRWREIAPSLPDEPIEVFGPPLTSGSPRP